MRPLLLALIATLTVNASTIATTSCTAGTITATPCPGDVNLSTGLSGPDYFVSAFAQASDTPPGNIVVLAEATAFYSREFGVEEIPLSATAEAIVNDTGLTTGPVRSGFIKISESIYSLHGLLSTTWSMTDGPFTYGGGPFAGQACLPGSASGDGCSGSATFPFELGIPIQVYASASDGAGVLPGASGAGSDDQVTLTFGLFEANGTTPVGFFAVPEPSTYGLLLSAVGAFLFCRRPAHGTNGSAIAPRV